MSRSTKIMLGVILTIVVFVGVRVYAEYQVKEQSRRMWDAEVAYYVALADSEIWCFLVQQPEGHTWAFHEEYYDDVIREWERVTRTGLRVQIAEHRDWKHEKYPSVIIIRIIESDKVIFFFHAIPGTPDAGITYWRAEIGEIQ